MRDRRVVVAVVAVLALGGLFALGDRGDAPTVAVALMAAVPLFAAIFLSAVGTTIVSILTLAAAGLVTWLRADAQYDGYVVPLVGVLVASLVAIASAALHGRRGAHAQAVAGAAETILVASAVSPPTNDTDAMTGLLNRRGVIRALGPQNTGDERVVAFLDCDGFRRVNEQHGSEIGDEFLQAIAGRLRHSLPARDAVARWDGDEFMVVMSVEASLAKPALERVAGTINGHPIRTAAGPIETSMSVGAAVWLPGQDLEDVISRAGRALHTAKTDANGRVVLDEPSA